MEVTAYDVVFTAFLNRIQKDDTFLNRKVSIEDAQKMAEKHMVELLQQAVYRLTVASKLDLEIDFESNMDDENKLFNFKLNLTEIQILADLMFERYVHEKTIVLFNTLELNGFSDSEIKYLINPNTSLKEFKDSYSLMESDNTKSIYSYKKRSRKDNKRKVFDMSLLS